MTRTIGRRSFLANTAKAFAGATVLVLLGKTLSQQTHAKTPIATLLVDSGTWQTHFEGPGSTPLTLLMAAGLRAETEGLPGGTVVHSIGGIPNTAEKSWWYSINGVSPLEYGADYPLRHGDVVEWRYS